MANYAFSQALSRISASAAASIMSSNTAMVCILSSLLIKEQMTVEKILAVLFAIGGVTVISLDKEFAGDWVGIGLVIFSAASAACYKVIKFGKLFLHVFLGLFQKIQRAWYLRPGFSIHDILGTAKSFG
jgi:drug/metabolite transporter (DMT)-like permease